MKAPSSGTAAEAQHGGIGFHCRFVMRSSAGQNQTVPCAMKPSANLWSRPELERLRSARLRIDPYGRFEQFALCSRASNGGDNLQPGVGARLGSARRVTTPGCQVHRLVLLPLSLAASGSPFFDPLLMFDLQAVESPAGFIGRSAPDPQHRA